MFYVTVMSIHIIIRTDIHSCVPNAVHNCMEDNLQYLMQHGARKLAKYMYIVQVNLVRTKCVSS